MLRFINKTIIKLFFIRCRLLNYRFEIANNEKKIETACELRRTLFAEKKISSVDVDLYDEYDKYSVFFLCYYKSELIGTYRNILSTGELQLHKAFNLVLPDQMLSEECSELSALVIQKNHRKSSRYPAWGLFALSYLYAIDNEIKWWVGIADTALLSSFTNAGGEWGLLEELPLEDSHWQARSRFPNYYKKYRPKAFYAKPSSYSPITWVKNKIFG